MEHGDKDGIILPPQIAPEQVTLIPAWRNEEDRSVIEEYLQKLKTELGPRTVVAQRQIGERLGPVRFAAERTGSPVHLVVGSRERESGVVGYKLRHSGEQGTININELKDVMPGLMARVASEMLASSTRKRDDSIVEVEGDVTELIDVVNQGKMALAGWSGTVKDEQELKAEASICIRNYPDGLDDRKDPLTGKPSRAALFAKGY